MEAAEVAQRQDLRPRPAGAPRGGVGGIEVAQRVVDVVQQLVRDGTRVVRDELVVVGVGTVGATVDLLEQRGAAGQVAVAAQVDRADFVGQRDASHMPGTLEDFTRVGGGFGGHLRVADAHFGQRHVQPAEAGGQALRLMARGGDQAAPDLGGARGIQVGLLPGLFDQGFEFWGHAWRQRQRRARIALRACTKPNANSTASLIWRSPSVRSRSL